VDKKPEEDGKKAKSVAGRNKLRGVKRDHRQDTKGKDD